MEKVRSFVDRYGFFMLLVTCIAVIVGSGLWAYRQGAGDARDVQAGGPLETEAASEAIWIQLEPPVLGAVLRGFSEVAYLDTLGMYGVHEAVDLLADAGEAVHAAQPGVVTEVFRDALLGTVVVIGHEQGFETRYAALRWPPAVQEGEAVLAGQVIGVVGTAPSEAADPPHLHFAVERDGTAVDPAGVIGP